MGTRTDASTRVGEVCTQRQERFEMKQAEKIKENKRQRSWALEKFERRYDFLLKATRIFLRRKLKTYRNITLGVLAFELKRLPVLREMLVDIKEYRVQQLISTASRLGAFEDERFSLIVGLGFAYHTTIHLVDPKAKLVSLDAVRDRANRKARIQVEEELSLYEEAEFNKALAMYRRKSGLLKKR